MSQSNSTWRAKASDAFGLPPYIKALEESGFPKAAAVLLKIVDELKKSPYPPNAQWRIGSMESFTEAFSKDFGDHYELTRDFREDCLLELFDCFYRSAVVASSLTDDDLKKMCTVIDYFWTRIVEVKKSLDPVFLLLDKISDENSESSKPIEDVNDAMVFHLYAYIYLVLVEGVLDDLARWFYFHKTIEEKREIPSISQLKEKTIGIITAELTNLPVFLHNWDVRVNISNAIRHANTTYDAEKDSVHFVSWNPLTQQKDYDETITLGDFAIATLKLIGTCDAFIIIRDLTQINCILAYLGGVKA